MGRRRVLHKEPLAAVHISDEAYTFILSQAKRGEPRYKTVDRIIDKYQEMVEELSTFSEAYRRNLEEKLELQGKLDKFLQKPNIIQQQMESKP